MERERNAMGSNVWFTDMNPKLISQPLCVLHHPHLQTRCACFVQANMQHQFPLACRDRRGLRYCCEYPLRMLGVNAALQRQETDSSQTRNRTANQNTLASRFHGDRRECKVRGTNIAHVQNSSHMP